MASSTLAIFTIFLVAICQAVRHHPSRVSKSDPRYNLTSNNAPYSEEIAKRTLYFAYGAYCLQPDLANWSCKWCEYIPNFHVVNVTLTNALQAYVGFDVDQNQIVVSFRGTHNTRDWLDDFQLFQTAYPGVENGYVHTGFYESWTDVLKAPMMKYIGDLMIKYKGCAILLTGHSLGAALAQIAAMDVASYAKSVNDETLIYIYDYGSPRWGNLIMAQYFESVTDSHFRIVNRRDPVPGFPAQDTGNRDNYHHTWTEIRYTNDDPLTYVQCDGSGEDKKCRYLPTRPDDHLNYFGIYESCAPAQKDKHSKWV